MTYRSLKKISDRISEIKICGRRRRWGGYIVLAIYSLKIPDRRRTKCEIMSISTDGIYLYTIYTQLWNNSSNEFDVDTDSVAHNHLKVTGVDVV